MSTYIKPRILTGITCFRYHDILTGSKGSSKDPSRLKLKNKKWILTSITSYSNIEETILTYTIGIKPKEITCQLLEIGKFQMSSYLASLFASQDVS